MAQLDDQQQDAAPDDAPEPSLRDTIMEAAARQRDPALDAEKAPEPEATREAPAEKPAAERKDGRDEQGRFAAKEPDSLKALDQAQKPQNTAESTDAQQPAPQAVRPPPGWSPQSKADFEKLPGHIQADIAKREQEIDRGFAKLTEYKDLEPLAALAKQNGTTLSAAVQNYRQFEVQLQQDFLGGIGMICQRFGIDPAQLGQVLAQRGQQAPHERQAAPAPQIDPGAIARQAAEAVRAQMEQERTEQAIKAFASDPKNLYFENVKPVMAKLVSSGLAGTIEQAYTMACGLVPEVAALINQRSAPQPTANPAAAVHQAQRAAKATIGAPSAGLKPGSQPDANASLRDTIRAAVDAQQGRA